MKVSIHIGGFEHQQIQTREIVFKSNDTNFDFLENASKLRNKIK